MRRIFDIADKVIINILGILLIFFVILTSAQVILRYVFNSPLPWAEEFIGFLMIYFGLIGGSWGIKHSIHIAMEVFVKKFMKKAMKFVYILETLSYIFLGIMEIVYGINIMKLTVFQILPATGIKVSYSYAALPIAGALMLFFALERLVEMKGERA